MVVLISSGFYSRVKEGFGCHSRRTFWIGAALAAVVIVVLAIVYGGVVAVAATSW